MKDENLKYGFEHWKSLHTLGKAIEANMVEVPGGIATIGDRVFQVGTFKISKSPVTELCWGKVMGNDTLLSHRFVTDVSFAEISDFLQRIRIPWKRLGYLTIPTEAQFLLAQDGFICTCRKHKEICLTQFRELDDMWGHHFFDNLPKEEPFDLVVRQDNNRHPLSYKQTDKDTGFRLALVDYYMTRRQISNAIISALEFSEYRSTYTKSKDGSECRINFEYSGNEAKVCPPNPQNGCLMMFPEQVKDDTIVVSTDVIRLPQEMDPDDIRERMVKMNAHDKNMGIRYEVPFLYHEGSGINRAVLVIKEFRAISEDNVIKSLPIVIKEVLNATGDFKGRFFRCN